MIRAQNTSYWLIEVVTKAVLTVYGNIIMQEEFKPITVD
jgi:hypothetical protein